MLKNKILISIIGIYIFGLCILPQILSETVKAVCNNVTKNSAYKIELQNFKTKASILPKLSLQANEITITSKKNSNNIKVINPKITFRLFPLLSGRLHLNEIAIQKINLNANLIDELELEKDFFEKLKKTKICCDSINIGSFEALFYQKDLKTPIIYKGKDFNFQRKNRYIRLQNNSTLNVAGKESKVVSNLYLPKNNDLDSTIFDVEISKINLAPLRAYFKNYLPADLKELKGEISASATKEGLITELNDCAILMNDPSKSIIFPSGMQIKSKFNITRNFINFEEIFINSNNINIFIGGKLYDYFGKTMPSIDFKIRINKSRIEDIINLLPAFSIEELNVEKLKKYRFYGNTLANLSIKGRFPEPEVFGDIYISDGILIKPIPQTTTGANIKLNFNGKHANFDVTVPAGQGETVWVKGSQELYNIKYADLTVKSSSSVSLKNAQDVVIPLHEILNFIIGPVPIIDLNGAGNIDILVKGNRKNPHIWGNFNITNSSVSFKDMPNLKFSQLDANLAFTDQNSVFISQKAILNNRESEIKGICDLSGKFDYDITAPDQPIAELHKAIMNSKMIPTEIKKIIPTLDNLTGNADLKLKVYGNVQNIKDLKFNENTFAKGEILLKDNIIEIQKIKLEKTSGNINFDKTDVDTTIKSFIGDLPLLVNAKIKNDIADINLDIPKINPNFLISDEELRKKQYLPLISLKGKYKGNANNIEYDKINLKSVIVASPDTGKIKYDRNGIINVENNRIIIKDISGFINNKNNTFNIDLNINNAFSNNPDINGSLNAKFPDLLLINEILSCDILPQNIKNYTKDFEFTNGNLNLNAKIFNNKINTTTDISGISFIYLPLQMPVDIINGKLIFKNNTLKLDKINLLADQMPVLADGEIRDLFDKQNFNLYFNSKPKQDFIDKYINKNQVYPIKIKGDIVYWVKVKGVPNNYDLKADIDMSKDSSFYHFGATIGDIENAIEVSLDSKITDGNNHKIREFSYDKIIDSQSGKQTKLNLLKAKGGVRILRDDLIFNDLIIKTNHPTDARIFNIIFRKPNIKQGQFTSNLKINGKLSNAKVLGDFHIFETNIPFLDTTMKNIELIFKDRIINFNSKGEILGNEIVFDGILKNNLVQPYKIEKANLYTKDLDLNRIIDKLKLAEVEETSTFETFENFDLNSIIINDFNLKADNIMLRNIHATNFDATISYDEKGEFNADKFLFNIAQGELCGKYSYNMKNNDMNISMHAESINANDISWAIFDLKNQIFGDLTGNINLACNGTDFNHCMETLSGNSVFNVKDGKMPKLGSLEYLLKAGNLLKGGLTGISINSIIDLITPAKTGDFSDIFGSIRIKDGIARNVEITTKGDDLSLFIGGTYNFATSIADMEVLGILSRKISTMFGPIGNVSINTLFNIIPGVDLSKDSLVLERINKIPGIELSSKAYRKFIAEIKGNINGDDYVTSFKWIN